MIEESGSKAKSIPLNTPDPDPGGPKTCGSGRCGSGFGSGSATLVLTELTENVPIPASLADIVCFNKVAYLG